MILLLCAVFVTQPALPQRMRPTIPSEKMDYRYNRALIIIVTPLCRVNPSVFSYDDQYLYFVCKYQYDRIFLVPVYSSTWKYMVPGPGWCYEYVFYTESAINTTAVFYVHTLLVGIQNDNISQKTSPTGTLKPKCMTVVSTGITGIN